MDPIEQLLTELLARNANAVTKEDLDALLETKLAAAGEHFAAQAAEAVQKALPANDREGVGRKGVVESPEDPREADPAAYIAKKAATPAEMTGEDKALAWGIMEAAMRQGMKD